MKLMISVINKQEALIAQQAGANLIDIKNPKEGSLGAQSPAMIRDIVAALESGIEVSATLGDVPFLPCTIAQAAYAVASFGVTYVKVGLRGCMSMAQARAMSVEIMAAISPFKGVNMVVAGYADYREQHTLSPFELVRAATGTGAAGILIDTLSKDGRNLFDFMTKPELAALVSAAHDAGLLCALAGSINLSHVEQLLDIGADISGVRGAICAGGREGSLVPAKIAAFQTALSAPVR